MKAMILAAGLGTRLGGLGRRLPKVLVDVGGMPLLARHLAYLQEQGVRRVVINAHHRAEYIQSFVHECDIVALLVPDVPSDFGHDVFPKAVDQGLAVFAWRLSSPVIDIGTPQGLSLARANARPCSDVKGGPALS